MSNAIPDRYISFKKNGQYYVFNSLKTGLKLIPFRTNTDIKTQTIYIIVFIITFVHTPLSVYFFLHVFLHF